MVKIELLINNEDVTAADYFEVKDPGRLTEVVGSVAMGTEAQVNQAIEAAHQAFLKWRKTDVQERCALLLKAATIVEEAAASLVPLISKESGMLPAVVQRELGAAANVVRDTAEAAANFFEPVEMEDDVSWVSIEKRPLGVIAGIVPWNAPVILTMQKLAPAVVCGNTIVIKPSPTAPLGISVLLKKIAALFPPGVVNVIHGGAETGAALTTHPLVRKISFTGGGTTAKLIMKSAADSLKGVHFELGGNDPAIVLDDARIDEAIPHLLAGIFRRSGQFCYAVKRVYVPKAIYDPFFDALCDHVNRFKIGHQLDEQVTFGPVNNVNQYKYVKGLMERAEQGGGKVVQLGEQVDPGNWDNGYYLRPAVVRDPDPNQEIVTCEQFGPIIPLVPYETEEEALRMANSTEYGLGSSVWSSDFERAVRFARQIEAGMTFINQNGQSRLGLKHMPFGGVKQSGLGRENSAIGLSEYIEYHSINYHK